MSRSVRRRGEGEDAEKRKNKIEAAIKEEDENQ